MNKFAKLKDDGALEMLTESMLEREFGYTQATDATRERVAAEHGFAPFVELERPHEYTQPVYELQGGSLICVWAVLPLTEVKRRLKDKVEAWKEQMLNEPQVIAVEALGFDILLDTRAQLNLVDLVQQGQGSTWIDAEDVLHDLSFEQIKQLVAAIRTYTNGIYGRKMLLFAQIDECESVEELLALDL